jgi:hypothetical protein
MRRVGSTRLRSEKTDRSISTTRRIVFKNVVVGGYEEKEGAVQLITPWLVCDEANREREPEGRHAAKWGRRGRPIMANTAGHWSVRSPTNQGQVEAPRNGST